MPIGQRTIIDRPDDSDLPQIHLVCAIAADGTDRAFDTDGAIKTSIESISYWFKTESSGLDFRWDTYQGELDVTFSSWRPMRHWSSLREPMFETCWRRR